MGGGGDGGGGGYQARQFGVPIEAMDTVNALATFNVLTEEGRVVVAALLPLDPYDPDEPLLAPPLPAAAAAAAPQPASPPPAAAPAATAAHPPPP